MDTDDSEPPSRHPWRRYLAQERSWWRMLLGTGAMYRGAGRRGTQTVSVDIKLVRHRIPPPGKSDLTLPQREGTVGGCFPR